MLRRFELRFTFHHHFSLLCAEGLAFVLKRMTKNKVGIKLPRHITFTRIHTLSPCSLPILSPPPLLQVPPPAPPPLPLQLPLPPT